MLRLVLSKVQDLLGGPHSGSLNEEDSLEVGQLRLAPLPLAVRVDSALPLGRRGDLQISRMLWVTPPSGGRPSGKLEALFYPN
jgi:hypothetical protein